MRNGNVSPGVVCQSWTGDHSPQPGQRSSGTVELDLRRLLATASCARSAESFVAQLKPRDVLVIGAERLPRSVVTRNGGRTPAHAATGGVRDGRQPDRAGQTK
jgi:hypothetical protein